ncbi:hypothetical protein [uncultured Reyranella sp.]|uniref:hypothetical protein n=1 Tax=uncultured Reyranella sp. TaxID=735512 RepID=UPI0025D0F718|nr:hypothetical protein [uncultured Reyranella sp.]
MKILFAINQLSEFVGGSLVPVEVAEYLHGMGHACTIAANHVDEPLATLVTRQGIVVTDEIPALNAFDFDLVWLQNHTAPLLRYELVDGSRERTLFVFAHLSGLTFHENPGLVFEPLLADVTIANSENLKRHLTQLDVPPDGIVLYPNPAPAGFWRIDPAAEPAQTPTTVQLISNHAPPEIIDALALCIQRGIDTAHIGQAGTYVRVTPEMLGAGSAVVSVGKSVQYAVARGIPPYIYDRWGGPGYLTVENFERAASANFSGRCCFRKIDAQQIAEEIVEGFPAACRFLAGLSPGLLRRYRMEPYIDQLLSRIDSAPPNAARLETLIQKASWLSRERFMALGIRDHFRGHKAGNAKIRQMRRETRKLKRRLQPG